MPRKEKKYHFIYKTVNLINNKYYVGMHSTDNLDDGYLGSGKHLRYSINKYGVTNFKLEILEFLDNRIQLKIKERAIVNAKLLSDCMCMNIAFGGGGNWELVNSNSDIQKAKNIKSQIKQKLLRETDPEWCSRRAENISKGNKKSYENGRIANPPNWTGKKHSQETKNKIGLKSSIHQKGCNNSQYNTCWICNLELQEIKKIKKENLEVWLNDGWLKGKKLKIGVSSKG